MVDASTSRKEYSENAVPRDRKEQGSHLWIMGKKQISLACDPSESRHRVSIADRLQSPCHQAVWLPLQQLLYHNTLLSTYVAGHRAAWVQTAPSVLLSGRLSLWC